MTEKNVFSLHIILLKITGIWPSSNILSSVLPLVCTSYSAFGSILGIIYLISHNINDNSSLAGYAFVASDYFGYLYTRWCIRSSISDITYLMDVKKVFQKFYPNKEFIKSANKASQFTKIFVMYAVIGNIVNDILALYDGDTCNEARSDILKRRDPCGTISRAFSLFDVNKFPLYHIYYFLQVVGCFTITMGVLMSAAVQICMVQYTTDQLSYVRNLINSLDMEEEAHPLKKKINLIVDYHVNIIRYLKMVDQAFSKMMLIHLTLTSLVISVLGFLVLTSDNVPTLLRHCLHLGGWLMLLSLTCYYGQRLIDESLSISSDIYNIPWYLAHPSIQKDVQMIMRRAGTRLKVTCAGIGELSLNTFLMVMRTAYSYLALFFNLKG